MKGYKVPVAKGEDGEAAPEATTGKPQRESTLPEI